MSTGLRPRGPCTTKGPSYCPATAARAVVLAAAVLLLLTLLAACGGGTSGEPLVATSYEAAVQPGPFGVGVTTLEFIDTSRPLEANGQFSGADERPLTVEVWYPAQTGVAPEARAAPLDRSSAPYPLIVFAHGFSGSRLQSATYTRHLASHGYIVAAPDFPGSKGDAPGGPRLSAVLDQPGDVSFVIDQLIALHGTSGHLLQGAVDDSAIGLSGHSLGGLTTLLTVYGPSRDTRISAALPIAPASCFLPDDLADGESVPVLFITGANDLITPVQTVRYGYSVANPPAYLVELAGGSHIRFADVDIDDVAVTEFDELGFDPDAFIADAARLDAELGGNASTCLPSGDPPRGAPLTLDRQQELLRAFATPFFDAYLRHSDNALTFLVEELPDSVPEASLQSRPE